MLYEQLKMEEKWLTPLLNLLKPSDYVMHQQV